MKIRTSHYPRNPELSLKEIEHSINHLSLMHGILATGDLSTPLVAKGYHSPTVRHKWFEVGAKIIGPADTVKRGSRGAYQELLHQDGRALVVNLSGKKMNHSLGYVFSADLPIERKLAQAVFDAVSGAESTHEPDELVINHAALFMNVVQIRSQAVR